MKFTLFVVAMVAGGANAHAKDHLECKTTGSFSWGCRVVEPEVSPPIEYGGELVDTSFKVEYRLDCPGHNMNLRLRSGKNESVLRQSPAVDFAVVEGDGPIELVDSDPRRTRRLIFRGSCQFEVVAVSKTPSAKARESWGQLAIAQAKTLRHVQSLYLLATDYEALDSWNQTRLKQVQERLDALVERFPRVVHYKVLLRTVTSTLDGAPAPHTDQAVADAALNLAQEYREELETELGIARAMAERFEHFKMAVQKDLEDALEEVTEVGQ